MTLDKDLIPPLKALIKASYSPVLKRSIANLTLLGFENVRLEHFKGQTDEFMLYLQSYKGTNVVKAIISGIRDSKESLVMEVLRQYDIDKDKEAFDIYFDELLGYFDKHLGQIEKLAHARRFNQLAQLTKYTEH